jgi:hypothetical protein
MPSCSPPRFFEPNLWRRIALLFLVGAAPVAPFSAQAAVFGEHSSQASAFDDRVPIGTAEWNSAGVGDWVRGGGTIHCDGRQRGSAMILDTRAFGAQPNGLVLATAAHVLYDLESGTRFESCAFHYLGLSQLPGYRGQIDLSSASMGGFDPRTPHHTNAFGQGDWAFLHVPEGISAANAQAGVIPIHWAELSPEEQAKHQLNLLSWSERHGAMSISLDCKVTSSGRGDLGGGEWPGQLLDNCDSGQGASGGGLVASFEGHGWLIGVRTGTHYDGTTFPLQKYPYGPPPGSPWDARTNTNFARAIDAETIEALRQFLEDLGNRSR